MSTINREPPALRLHNAAPPSRPARRAMFRYKGRALGRREQLAECISGAQAILDNVARRLPPADRPSFWQQLAIVAQRAAAPEPT